MMERFASLGISSHNSKGMWGKMDQGLLGPFYPTLPYFIPNKKLICSFSKSVAFGLKELKMQHALQSITNIDSSLSEEKS